MEEKKETNGVNPLNKGDKMDYNELNNLCTQLYQQNRNLINQLNNVNISNMFRRLDYLFLVLKYESVIKDSDFVNSCVAEIKEAITIPKEQVEDK